MKRNCYLDLPFHPSSAYSPSHNSMNKLLNIKKQLVVNLHNRRRYKFDITELQARGIIWLANREMEERIGSKRPSPTSLQPQALLMYAPQGFSIKRSLQNFLHERKKRSQSHISIATHNSVN